MTAIPIATFIILDGGARLADGLAEERCIRSAETRNELPSGTITIGADDCYAVADGRGGFHCTGLDGTFPAPESVVLPAYVIAGPGLPPLIPGGGRELVCQDEVEENCFEFEAIDAMGSLFKWASDGDMFVDFAWEAAGQIGQASPVFPITAWC